MIFKREWGLMTHGLIDIDSNEIGAIAFRFWAKAKWVGSCFQWQGKLDKDGYGKFSVRKKTYRASRFAYFLYYARDPGDKLVLHRCDNPSCVNPRHLLLGTQADNVRDMDSKGRGNRVRLQGIRSGRALLSEEDVREIRQSSKSFAQLAREKGVSRGCIQHIKQGRTWRHLK